MEDLAPSYPLHQAVSDLTRASADKPVVNHSVPFAFPARKQLPKRTIQDSVEEQNEDKDRAAKKRKKEEGEGPGWEGKGVCVCMCVYAPTHDLEWGPSRVGEVCAVQDVWISRSVI